MNELQKELMELFVEQAEVEKKLSQIKEKQVNLHKTILGIETTEDKLKMFKPNPVKKRKTLVADKVKKEEPTITLTDYIVEAMHVLEEPLDVKTIHEYIQDMRPTTYNSVYAALNAGLKKGYFKRSTTNTRYGKKTQWSLNEAKAPKRKVIDHKRPNYGLGKAVAEYVNKHEPNTLLFPEAIFNEIKVDFKAATERGVEQALHRLIKANVGQGEKRDLGEQKAYVFKSKIRV